MTIRLEALPELTAAIAQLEQLAAAEGIRYTVADFGGFRTQADTTEILGYRDAEYASYVADMQAQGRTPLSKNKWRPIAPFGKSFHDYGAARDLRITGRPSSMSADDALAALDALAPQAGLRSGAAYGDPGHFELAISLEEAAARWAAYVAGDATGDPGDTEPPGGGDGSSSSSSTGLAFGLVLLLAAGVAYIRSH